MTPTPSAPAPLVGSSSDVEKALGSVVRIEGVARNAKLGAAIVNDALVVFCLDRESWPNGVEGTRVVVEGVLERTTQFQVPKDGPLVQGTEGPMLVFRRSTLLPR